MDSNRAQGRGGWCIGAWGDDWCGGVWGDIRVPINRALSLLVYLSKANTPLDNFSGEHWTKIGKWDSQHEVIIEEVGDRLVWWGEKEMSDGGIKRGWKRQGAWWWWMAIYREISRAQSTGSCFSCSPFCKKHMPFIWTWHYAWTPIPGASWHMYSPENGRGEKIWPTWVVHDQVWPRWGKTLDRSLGNNSLLTKNI